MRLIPYLLTFAPLVLIAGAWVKLYRGGRGQLPSALAMITLGIATVNAAFAAGTFLYYESQAPSHLPPWQDPEILNLGLLVLMAPVAMILSFVATLRGAPKWLFLVIELASVPLLVVGFFSAMSV